MTSKSPMPSGFAKAMAAAETAARPAPAPAKAAPSPPKKKQPVAKPSLALGKRAVIDAPPLGEI